MCADFGMGRWLNVLCHYNVENSIGCSIYKAMEGYGFTDPRGKSYLSKPKTYYIHVAYLYKTIKWRKWSSAVRLATVSLDVRKRNSPPCCPARGLRSSLCAPSRLLFRPRCPFCHPSHPPQVYSTLSFLCVVLEAHTFPRRSSRPITVDGVEAISSTQGSSGVTLCLRKNAPPLKSGALLRLTNNVQRWNSK